MITHPAFVWWHLPRSGGTATTCWLRAVDAALSLGLLIDPDDQRAKHDNRRIRDLQGAVSLPTACTAMNLRPLPEWLLSNYKFARRAGLEVPFERYLGGEYFSRRVGDWCPADWWLDYFAVDEGTRFFRTDRLEADWRDFLREQLAVSIPGSLRMEVTNDLPPRMC